VFLGIRDFWEFCFFEKPENPLKLGLKKLIQNIENPEWETYKMLKMLGIQSGKIPEIPKPRKTALSMS
jgi:hypothetical protein